MSNGRVYFSNVDQEWTTEAASFTYWVCPRKWWSIREWKVALDFRRNVNLMYMLKD